MNFNSFEDAPYSQWLNLIIAAETQAHYHFTDELKQYLVMTLQHYTSELTLPDSIISIDYLEALRQSGSQQSCDLRDIGDQCLLLTGLFPERIEKKNLSLDYVISLGKQSYLHLATNANHSAMDTSIFNELEYHFVGLVDVLYTMRFLEINKRQP